MRLMNLRISPHFFLMLKGCTIKCTPVDIPPDVKVVGMFVDYDRDSFVITLLHDSFDDLKIGEDIPILQGPEFTEVDV